MICCCDKNMLEVSVLKTHTRTRKLMHSPLLNPVIAQHVSSVVPAINLSSSTLRGREVFPTHTAHAPQILMTFSLAGASSYHSEGECLNRCCCQGKPETWLHSQVNLIWSYCDTSPCSNLIDRWTRHHRTSRAPLSGQRERCGKFLSRHAICHASCLLPVQGARHVSGSAWSRCDVASVATSSS